MRNKLFVLLVAVAAFGLVGCNKEKGTETTAVNAERQKDKTTTVVENNAVPAATPAPAPATK